MTKRSARNEWKDAVVKTVVSIAAYFLASWVFMLSLGAAHSFAGGQSIPHFGYWSCWWLTFGLVSVIKCALIDYGTKKE